MWAFSFSNSEISKDEWESCDDETTTDLCFMHNTVPESPPVILLGLHATGKQAAPGKAGPQ